MQCGSSYAAHADTTRAHHTRTLKRQAPAAAHKIYTFEDTLCSARSGHPLARSKRPSGSITAGARARAQHITAHAHTDTHTHTIAQPPARSKHHIARLSPGGGGAAAHTAPSTTNFSTYNVTHRAGRVVAQIQNTTRARTGGTQPRHHSFSSSVMRGRGRATAAHATHHCIHVYTGTRGIPWPQVPRTVVSFG